MGKFGAVKQLAKKAPAAGKKAKAGAAQTRTNLRVRKASAQVRAGELRTKAKGAKGAARNKKSDLGVRAWSAKTTAKAKAKGAATRAGLAPGVANVRTNPKIQKAAAKAKGSSGPVGAGPTKSRTASVGRTAVSKNTFGSGRKRVTTVSAIRENRKGTVKGKQLRITPKKRGVAYGAGAGGAAAAGGADYAKNKKAKK